MVILETVKFHIRNKSRFYAQYVYCFTPHMLNYPQFQWLSVSDAANIPHRLWPMGLISSAHNDPTSSLSGSVSNIRRDDSSPCTALCVFLLVFKHWEWIKSKLLCPGASSHAAWAGWLRPPDAWCCLPARKIAGSAWSGLGLHTWLLLLRTRLVSASQSPVSRVSIVVKITLHPRFYFL